MKRTNISHFSHVLAAVQRTATLPGGDVRGLPNGRAIDGLQGIQSFPLDLAEAQKEFQLERVRSALERVKQLEVQFNGIASRWDSSVSSLIADIRQGKQLKNLEKLKELKAAQIRMQQLVLPARKAFQDLVTALDHDAIAQVRECSAANPESATNESKAHSVRVQEHESTAVSASLTGSSSDPTPDADALANFAANYRCGPRLQLKRVEHEKLCVVPELEVGKFYYVAGLARPRVIRIRELQRKSVRVFDTHETQEVMLDTNELADLITKGIWLLVSDGASGRPRSAD